MKYETISDGTPASPSFGVALVCGDTPLQAIPGITPSKAEADELTGMLNRLAVEPCHFEDIIEDFLTDFSI